MKKLFCILISAIFLFTGIELTAEAKTKSVQRKGGYTRSYRRTGGHYTKSYQRKSTTYKRSTTNKRRY